LSRSDSDDIENLGGWLTTVVARVSLNMLQTRKSRRQEPQGAHVPEEIAGRADADRPEDEAILADSIGPALLVILDTLDPAERLAFVLHDMFAVPFDEIASIVGRYAGCSPAARQPGSSPGAGGRRIGRHRSRSVSEKSWPRSSPPRATVSLTLFSRCSRSQTKRSWAST